MADKFIPNGDVAFQQMAGSFSRYIAEDPQRFAVTQADSDALAAAFANFSAALVSCRTGGTRSQHTTRAKDNARAEVERMIRRLALLIRANEAVDGQAKFLLKLRERQSR